MLLKRVLNVDEISEYVINETGLEKEELILPINLEEVFYTIFARQVYKGKREASVIAWSLARITDGWEENIRENLLIWQIMRKKSKSKWEERKTLIFNKIYYMYVTNLIGGFHGSF